MPPDQTALQAALGSPQERARILRLCTRLTGDRAAAEDLAQETLVEAWRHLSSLRRADAFPSWVGGIAANVCRRWQRRAAVESLRMTPLGGAADVLVAFDAEGTLDRSELSALLDRAMGQLRPADRQVLVARYIEDKPLAEIAASGGWTANTAAVRLRRGREALHHLLATRMRAEAVEFGLIASEAVGWEQTRLWCFRCGRERLEGQFTARDSASGSGPLFAVRCRRCDQGTGDVAFSSAHQAMEAVGVLGPVRGYKPAFHRVNAWWAVQIQRGLREGVWKCWSCTGPMARLSDGGTSRFGNLASFRCGACRAEFSLPASGLTFHSPAGQGFWRRHPRMRVVPERTIACSGRRAVVTRYEDVTGSDFLQVLYAADTFQPLQTWGDAPG